MNETKIHRCETCFNRKKNSIINHVIIKSHIKTYKNAKNMTKRSLNEKKNMFLCSEKEVISLT